MVKKWYALKKL